MDSTTLVLTAVLGLLLGGLTLVHCQQLLAGLRHHARQLHFHLRRHLSIRGWHRHAKALLNLTTVGKA